MSDVAEPGRDPNYILSQNEFAGGVQAIHTTVEHSAALTRNTVRRETAGLRESIGWVLLLIALQMAILGFGMIKGTIKGSPSR